MKLRRRRLLLDFSVVAPGGSRTYANGFLRALPDVARSLRDRAEFSVALPGDCFLFAHEERLLREAQVGVHRLSTAVSGTWRSRLATQVRVPWLVVRRRITDVFVPRDIPPLLAPARVTVLCRNVLVWTTFGHTHEDWGIRLRRAAGRLALRRCFRVLAVTRTVAGKLPRGVTPDGVVLHGCDLTPITVDEKLGGFLAGAGRLRLAALGTVEPHKRFSVVIDAAAALGRMGFKIELDIWGHLVDEDEANRIREIGVLQLGYDPLRGPLDSECRLDLFRHADVLVVGSSTESFGFPMVEAMRTSTVVVAPHSELVKEICGRCAVTYDEGSGESAARAIRDALPQLTELAEAGLRRSETLFTWDRCVRETLAVVLGPDDAGSDRNDEASAVGEHRSPGTLY